MKITSFSIFLFLFSIIFPTHKVVGNELSPDINDIMKIMSVDWYLIDLESINIPEKHIKDSFLFYSYFEIHLEWEENWNKLTKEEKILRRKKKKRLSVNSEYLAKLFIWPGDRGYLYYSIHYKNRILIKDKIPDRSIELCSDKNISCNVLTLQEPAGSTLAIGDTVRRSIEGIQTDDEFFGNKNGKKRRLVIKANSEN